MGRILFIVLLALTSVSAHAAEEVFLKNVADLQWLIDNANKIGVKVTERREYPRKETADWVRVSRDIDCETWRWPETMKPKGRELGLQILWIQIFEPELVNIKGWMRRDRTVNGQKVNTSGQFMLGFHKSGAAILGDDVHVEIDKGPSHDERKADLQQFMTNLDMIVAGCAAGYRAELEKKK